MNLRALRQVFFLLLLCLMVIGCGQPQADADVESVAVVETAVSTPQPTATLYLLPTSAVPITEERDRNIISQLPVITDDSLAPAPDPNTYQPKMPEHNFTTYVVERGDTPNIIADKVGISAATLLGGNAWMSQESNALQTGSELRVLPVDGALHKVKIGDTLEGIAEQYKVSVDDIVNYEPNNIEFTERLFVDSELLIPGVEIGAFYWTAPKSNPNNNGNWAVVGTGTFSWPVGGRCVTNYYWYGHAGLDVSLRMGAAVSAADTGTVTYASWASGTYYDYGNLIVVNHGNGFETFYAHLSGINVVPGQIVEKGQLIGASGNSGRSSGPHIHIEIRLNDARLNPLDYLGGAVQDCT